MLGTPNAFGSDLIPGHPRMSLLKDRLSSAWNDLQSGGPGGFGITNWYSQIFDRLNLRYDLVIFNVGPSLGALKEL